MKWKFKTNGLVNSEACRLQVKAQKKRKRRNVIPDSTGSESGD